jgi:5-methylcytosine-specific restriction endonuclease McrA
MATFTKTCFYCKREFEATHPLANNCSPDCQKRQRSTAPRRVWPEPVEAETRPGKAGRRTGKARPEPGEGRPEPIEARPQARGIETVCRRCGKAMRDATGMRRYCSSTCRRAVQRKARRERLRRAYVEPVSRRRDEDKCRICGEPVDFTRQPPDPFAATIDHVIALCRGGEHSYGNTQLAHLRCNATKGAS